MCVSMSQMYPVNGTFVPARWDKCAPAFFESSAVRFLGGDRTIRRK